MLQSPFLGDYNIRTLDYNNITVRCDETNEGEAREAQLDFSKIIINIPTYLLVDKKVLTYLFNRKLNTHNCS